MLMMRLPVFPMLLCVVFSVPFSAAAGHGATPPGEAVAQEGAMVQMLEPIRQDQGFKLAEGAPISVVNPYGSVYMRFGGYEHKLDIRSTIQQPEGAAKFAFAPAMRDGRFVVAPSLPEGVQLAEGQRIDLVLYVPQGHALSVDAAIGDIECRGLRSDIDLKTGPGRIQVIGTHGTVQAQSDDGRIEVSLQDGAREGSVQRFVSRTGSVTLNVGDKLDAEVSMSTSHQFATDYSLTVRHLDGQEPNKTATATVGAPKPGERGARIEMRSLVNEVRLQRRGVFIDPE
jgi:hypothetical protein